MTTATAADPLVRRQLTSWHAVVVLVAAGVAWLGLVQLAGSDMTSARAFIPAWALMMTAMMLPAVALVASLYTRTITPPSWARQATFLLGYLVVWVGTALPAYGLSVLVQHAVTPHPTVARVTGAAIFGLCGAYQLSGLKDRCLRHCRSPLGQLMRYASYAGRARDLRVGLHHAAYCLGCCWALMLLLFAFGTMALLAALGLTVVVVLEKLTPFGPRVARVTGWLALGLAVAALAVPELAPGLAPMDSMM